jgi:hypothetical protein
MSAYWLNASGGLLPNPSSGQGLAGFTVKAHALAGGSAVLGQKLFTPKVVHEVNLEERMLRITCCGALPRSSTSPSCGG